MPSSHPAATTLSMQPLTRLMALLLARLLRQFPPAPTRCKGQSWQVILCFDRRTCTTYVAPSIGVTAVHSTSVLPTPTTVPPVPCRMWALASHLRRYLRVPRLPRAVALRSSGLFCLRSACGLFSAAARFSELWLACFRQSCSCHRRLCLPCAWTTGVRFTFAWLLPV